MLPVHFSPPGAGSLGSWGVWSILYQGVHSWPSTTLMCLYQRQREQVHGLFTMCDCVAAVSKRLSWAPGARWSCTAAKYGLRGANLVRSDCCKSGLSRSRWIIAPRYSWSMVRVETEPACRRALRYRCPSRMILLPRTSSCNLPSRHNT